MTWNVWFDDGDLSVYTYAYPILKAKGITATVAVITDYVGKNYPKYRVQPCPSMNIPQLKELIANGWEIASHSLSHPHFPKLTMKEAEHEIAESKIWIMDNLDVTPTKFAFPYGEATPELIELAEQYYPHVRPIPPETHVDAIYHRVTLTPTGPEFDLAGEASPEFLKEMKLEPTKFLDNHKWIILTGCNNSGTTLLECLMGAHPKVDLLQHEAHQIRVKGTRTPYPDQFILPSPAVVRKSAGGYLNRAWTEALPLFREIKTTPWVAKLAFLQSRETVNGDYTLLKSQPFMVALPWFQQNFSNLRVFVIVRNGYAVAEGNARRFNKAFDQHMSIRRAARHWRVAHEILLNDLPELKHYAVLRYEDLCVNPKALMHQTLHDLELGGASFDYSDMLSKPIPIFKGYRQEVKLKNMNPQSFSNLTDEDLDVIEEEAGEILNQFGYTRPQLSHTQ